MIVTVCLCLSVDHVKYVYNKIHVTFWRALDCPLHCPYQTFKLHVI